MRNKGLKVPTVIDIFIVKLCFTMSYNNSSSCYYSIKTPNQYYTENKLNPQSATNMISFLSPQKRNMRRQNIGGLL